MNWQETSISLAQYAVSTVMQKGERMKKAWKTMLLICLLILGSALPVSAATLTKSGKTATSITPTKVSTGSEDFNKFPVYEVSYVKTDADVISVNNSQYYGKVIPVKVSGKGDLYVEITDIPMITYSTTVQVYTDAACITRADSGSLYMSTASDVGKLRITCSKKGTYYLAFYTYGSDYNNFTNNIFSFRTYFYSSANATLSNSKWLACAGTDYTNKYYKIVLDKSGIVLLQSNSNMYFDICNSKKSVLHSSVYFNSDNGRKAALYLKKGTYYFCTKGASEVYRVRYVFYNPGSKSYSITNNQTLTLHPASSSSYLYIAYKSKVNGYITITQSGDESAYVTLCDSSKKTLSSEDLLCNYNDNYNKLVYGVKKGTTYYLKIKSSYNPFKLKLKETSVSEKSGSSKKEAVKVSSGKTVKGTIQAGSSVADWYKFTLTKSQIVNVYLKGRTNSWLKVVFYNSSGKNVGETILNRGFSVTMQSSGKFSKGTYYAKIYRYDSKSSGYYTLKWK